MGVIFLAYAFSEKNRLDALKDEYTDVYRIIVTSDAPQTYSIHPDPFATVESVNQYLKTFSGNISAFHFSGHAGKDHVLLGDKVALADGIINQLEASVKTGCLKLVVLNGCATHGQVARLQAIRVPVIIATTTSVGDLAAAEFARRFYKNVFESTTVLEKAYKDALDAALLATANGISEARHIEVNPESTDLPVWGIFGDEIARAKNPFHRNGAPADDDYSPGLSLFDRFFEIFKDPQNPRMEGIMQRMGLSIIPPGEKKDAILYSIPFPIAANMKKLADILSARKEYKTNDIFLRTYLAQAAQLYQTSIEFLGLIMLSQLWEIKLKFPAMKIPGNLQEILSAYFYLSAEQRAIYDYVPLIRVIRDFIDSSEKNYEGMQPFVAGQRILQDIPRDDYQFDDACNFLYHLHVDYVGKLIRPLNRDCRVTEDQLCAFFSKLRFLPRYHITSVRQIDILKYRHEPPDKALFKHNVVKLMRPPDEDQVLYYFMTSFLDNWGVILIKGKLDEKVIDLENMEMRVDPVDFLNLSPFVIDRSVFERNDASSVMFFSRYWLNEDTYEFCDVSCPRKTEDNFIAKRPKNPVKRKYQLQSICLQFEAFRKEILGEEQKVKTEQP